MSPSEAPFEQLDFLYIPSRDVAVDLAYLTDVLGGRVIFAIDSMGTRAAAVELTAGPPLVLRTGGSAGRSACRRSTLGARAGRRSRLKGARGGRLAGAWQLLGTLKSSSGCRS